MKEQMNKALALGDGNVVLSILLRWHYHPLKLEVDPCIINIGFENRTTVKIWSVSNQRGSVGQLTAPKTHLPAIDSQNHIPLILMVLILDYSGRNMSIPGLHALPRHQQTWYWLCSKGMPTHHFSWNTPVLMVHTGTYDIPLSESHACSIDNAKEWDNWNDALSYHAKVGIYCDYHAIDTAYAGP